MAKESNLWAFRAPEPLHEEMNTFMESETRTPSSAVQRLVTLGLEAHKAQKKKKAKGKTEQ